MSFAVFKDISIRVLKQISDEDASYSQVLRPIPVRPTTYWRSKTAYAMVKKCTGNDIPELLVDA